MKKRLFSLTVILGMLLCMMVAFSGCGGEKPEVPEENSTPATVEKITIKLGHPYDEKQPLHQGTVKFAELVAEKTDGNIEIKIFPNNTLGSSRDLVEGLQIGTIDMGLVPTTNVASFYKPIDIFYFPFIFRDKEHAYKVSDCR